MSDNTANQPTNFRTKDWVEINDEKIVKLNFKLCKTSILKSILFDYSDVYILVSGTITVATLAAGGKNNGKKVTFKNWIPMYNLIEYSVM